MVECFGENTKLEVHVRSDMIINHVMENALTMATGASFFLLL